MKIAALLRATRKALRLTDEAQTMHDFYPDIDRDTFERQLNDEMVGEFMAVTQMDFQDAEHVIWQTFLRINDRRAARNEAMAI